MAQICSAPGCTRQLLYTWMFTIIFCKDASNSFSWLMVSCFVVSYSSSSKSSFRSSQSCHQKRSELRKYAFLYACKKEHVKLKRLSQKSYNAQVSFLCDTPAYPHPRTHYMHTHTHNPACEEHLRTQVPGRLQAGNVQPTHRCSPQRKAALVRTMDLHRHPWQEGALIADAHTITTQTWSCWRRRVS
jgi:hypothetical protein